jgi:hypothetical protein
MRYVRRPSHSTVVAYLALVVALGGSAYAAIKLPAHSVGGKQLKTGAVSNKKLAGHAVTGSKVAKKTLTGTQINVAKLGTVPNAAHASNADHAIGSDTLGGSPASAFQPVVSGTCGSGSALTAVHTDGSVACSDPAFPATSVRRYGPVVVAAQTLGNPISIPPFTITPQCDTNGTMASNDYAYTLMTSSEDHSVFEALSDDGRRVSDVDVSAGTSEFVGIANPSVGAPGISATRGIALAPSGKQITFEVYQSANLHGHSGGECLFGGTVVLNH